MYKINDKISKDELRLNLIKEIQESNIYEMKHIFEYFNDLTLKELDDGTFLVVKRNYN